MWAAAMWMLAWRRRTAGESLRWFRAAIACNTPCFYSALNSASDSLNLVPNHPWSTPSQNPSINPSYPFDLQCQPRTFGTFSKIPLNTSKSPNGKVVQFVEAHNFPVEWHCWFARESCEKCKSMRWPIVLGAEFSAKFLCNLCSICCSNHPRAFVWVVEGKLLSNFCIQMFVHFCCKVWTKIESNRATLNCFWAGRARARCRVATCHVDPVVPRACAHAEAPGYPAVWGRRHYHCAPKAHDARRWPRPVPCGLPALAGGRTAFRHWPTGLRTSPPPPRPCHCSCRPWSSGETAPTRRRAYETPPPSFLARTRATPQSAAARH
jgi:hypothetical protein